MIPYEIAILFGILGFVYTNLLTQPEQIFSGWYKLLYKLFKIDARNAEGKGYHPLFMVLVHCEKCVAGQIAFWYYLIKFNYSITSDGYIWHAIFCAVAILSAEFIKLIHGRIHG
jgi:hypothetical protein